LTFEQHLVKSNFFMNYLFNTGFMIEKIRSIATGTTSVAAVYTKDLLNLEFSICRPQEQQKNAACLSALDELTAAHKDKPDALKAHKKGLLQNLFPDPAASSGGETVPKVRFPEFEGDGEWVENQLQEHCHNISSGKDKNQDDGKIDL